MNTALTKSVALRETLPTVFGYIGIGIAFGVLGHAAGLSLGLVVLMSLITYAGSAQFVAVSMLAGGSSILSIILAVFLINSRFILMSMSVAQYFKKESTMKNIVLASLLTDESYALAMNKVNYTQGQLSFEWLNTVNLISYGIWAGASGLGAWLGTTIRHPEALGLDFALVAMFIGLVYLQLISDRQLGYGLQLVMIGLTLVLVYGALIFIPKNFVVLVVTLLACGIGVLLKHVRN
ncbi:AzlC family ABC transporter permease [Weissella halotolerans]|nr:AzlC family ABC transporter permease [Weissella halotolerans]